MSFTPPGGVQGADPGRRQKRQPSSPLDDLIAGGSRTTQGQSGGSALGNIITGSGRSLGGRSGSNDGLDVLSRLTPEQLAQLETMARDIAGIDPDSPQGRAYMAEQAAMFGFGAEEGDFIGHLGERRWALPGDPGHPGGPGYYGPSGFGQEGRTTGFDSSPYIVGDEFDELAEMSTEDLRRWQEKMVTLGLANPKNIIYGVRDAESIKVMADLLSMSNAEGIGWGVLLGELESIAGEDGSLFDSDEDARKFTAPSYLAPDYATMAQKVKETMRSTLGRDPDESELAVLVGELQGWDRQAFDAQVESSRGEFEAQEAGAPASPDVQGVDPLARFNEFFEQKYEDEIDFVEDRDEHTPLSQASVGGGVDTLSQMSRGGA